MIGGFVVTLDMEQHHFEAEQVEVWQTGTVGIFYEDGRKQFLPPSSYLEIMYKELDD